MLNPGFQFPKITPWVFLASFLFIMMPHRFIFLNWCTISAYSGNFLKLALYNQKDPRIMYLLKCFFICKRKIFSNSFYTFSLIEAVLFWSEIFEIDFLKELHVLRSSESENIFFYRLIYVWVYYQHRSKTNNSRKFKFGI